MPFKRRFKDKYAGSSPENASVVRTLFDLLYASLIRGGIQCILNSNPGASFCPPAPGLVSSYPSSRWSSLQILFRAFNLGKSSKYLRCQGRLFGSFEDARNQRFCSPEIPRQVILDWTDRRTEGRRVDLDSRRRRRKRWRHGEPNN